jgi:hypothetical protein
MITPLPYKNRQDAHILRPETYYNRPEDAHHLKNLQSPADLLALYVWQGEQALATDESQTDAVAHTARATKINL